MLPPRKRSEASLNGGAIIVNKGGAPLKTSAPGGRRDEKGIIRRDGIATRKGSGDAPPVSGTAAVSDGSPARVKGMINGLLSRKRTDSLDQTYAAAHHSPQQQRDRAATSDSDGETTAPGGQGRKPTLSFKLANEESNALYDPFSSPRDPLSPRPATARGDETYALSPRGGERDSSGGGGGGGGGHHATFALDAASSSSSPKPAKRQSQDAESLRNALAREVQSSNNLRDKLVLAQKKFDFLERNREELAQLLVQLRHELGDAAASSSCSGGGGGNADADVSSPEDTAAAETVVVERRRSEGSFEGEKKTKPRSSSLESDDLRQCEEGEEGAAREDVSKRDEEDNETEGKAAEGGGEREGEGSESPPEEPTDQHAALPEHVLGLVDQAVALSSQTWERTEEARKEKEREDRKQALRQERDKKRANKQRERQLREERKAKKQEEEAAGASSAVVTEKEKPTDNAIGSPSQRKITLGGIAIGKRNSNGSYATAPIDLAKAGRTASSLMNRIAKGRFSQASEKTPPRKASTYTLDDIRNMYNDARKGRGFMREPPRDPAAAAPATGQNERKMSPVQTRRFRPRSQSASLTHASSLAGGANVSASAKPDKSLVDILLKPANLQHLVVHQEQTQKLHSFLNQKQSRPKYSQQDLLDLLGDSDDEEDGAAYTKHDADGVTESADRHGDESAKGEDRTDHDNETQGKATTAITETDEAEYKLVLSRLLQLEHALCRDLEVVVTQFWRLLSDGGSEAQELVAGGRVARLFANVEMLWALHRHLLSRLEHTKRQPVMDQNVAACFAATVAQQWIYVTYSDSLRQLMIAVDSATYHPDSLFRQAGYSRAELIAYLQKPLQHLMTYPHLLTELRHCAGTQHVHGEELSRAITTLSALTFKITAQPLLSSDQISIWSIQHTFHWLDPALDLAGTNRVVLREGTFNKLSSQGEIICRRVFLFNDLILVARVLQTRQCLLKTTIPLTQCLLYDCGEGSNAFELAVAGGEERAVLTASSREEKESWMEELTRCLLLCPRTDTADSAAVPSSCLPTTSSSLAPSSSPSSPSSPSPSSSHSEDA